MTPDERKALKNELVEEDSEFVDRLVDLHALLERYHLHFGYRVIDEITTFVALAREYVGDDDEVASTAFDLAVRQKVLPKLNGGRELDEPLRRLLAFLVDPEDFADERWRDAEDRWNEGVEAGPADGSGLATYPRSAHKTARMLNRLATTGFVSFLE